MSYKVPEVPEGENGLPAIGIVDGPHPPCTLCGSSGFPADIELTLKGNDAWLCWDCWTTKIPAEVQSYAYVDKAKVMALRQTPWSKSWRGWKRRSREEAPDDKQPTLILP